MTIYHQWTGANTGDPIPMFVSGGFTGDGAQRCLHDSCSECGGTGIKRNGGGACIHGISCPCQKCTPR